MKLNTIDGCFNKVNRFFRGLGPVGMNPAILFLIFAISK